MIPALGRSPGGRFLVLGVFQGSDFRNGGDVGNFQSTTATPEPPTPANHGAPVAGNPGSPQQFGSTKKLARQNGSQQAGSRGLRVALGYSCETRPDDEGRGTRLFTALSFNYFFALIPQRP